MFRPALQALIVVAIAGCAAACDRTTPGNRPKLVILVSSQTTLGGMPAGLVYPNMKKWSGDHGGYDAATTPGVLISNEPLTAAAASIVDIAPTVLKFFGVTIPSTLDGKPLF